MEIKDHSSRSCTPVPSGLNKQYPKREQPTTRSEQAFLFHFSLHGKTAIFDLEEGFSHRSESLTRCSKAVPSFVEVAARMRFAQEQAHREVGFRCCSLLFLQVV